MNERDFVYWLQGYFELHGKDELSEEQVKVIREHLQLVFKKETGNQSVSLEPWEFPLWPCSEQITC